MELPTYESAAEVPLPTALVGAFVASGRPSMPTDRAGRSRTEEVRQALTRMMADADFYFEYRRAMEAAFKLFGVPLPLDRTAVPHPEYDDAEIAARGFAGFTDPAALAAIALDPAAYEGISHLLHDEIPSGRAGPKELGSWLETARRAWPARVYQPSRWVLERLSDLRPNPPGPADPSAQALQAPSSTAPSTGGAGNPWLWLVVAGIGAVTGIVGIGVVGVGYSNGERAHADLGRFTAEVEAGRFAAAVGHFRDAQSVCEGPTWLVPASARDRYDQARQSPVFLERLLPSPDLDGSEGALRAAVESTSLGREPGYEFALGVTLRRRGRPAEAAVRFESVLTRLSGPGGPADPPPAKEDPAATPSDPPTLLASHVIGDAVGNLSEMRRTYAATLIEAGRYGPARQLLLRHTEGTRDRPFGSRFHLWLVDRLLAFDPKVPAPPAADPAPPNDPADLRDRAFLHLYRGHYTTAAELFRRARAHKDYAAVPLPTGTAVDGLRYFAAAAAVRSGRFGDRDSPPAEVAERWHAQALDWAKEDLRVWLGVFADPQRRLSDTYDWYTYLRYDYFLAVTRDHPLADTLSDQEQKDWARYWEELDRRFGGLLPDRLPAPRR